MQLPTIFKKFRTINQAPPAVEPSKDLQGEIGHDVWDLYTKDAFEKYDPDRLKQRKGHNIYNDMMYDDQIKAVMEFKKNAVLSRGWFFDVDEDNKQHQEIADLFYILISKITGSYTDKLLGMLNGLIHGFSISEKIFNTFEYNDKTWWGIKDIKLRPALTFVDRGFTVDPHGNLIKVQQRYGTAQVEIPLDKIIHFVHQPDVDLHYGESDLKAAYRAYWSKDIAIKFQNIFLERHASGFLWAQVSKNLDAKQKQDLQAVMNNVSALTSAIMPDGVMLNSILPQSTDAFSAAISQHDKAIAKSLLVPNLLGVSEQGQHGSLAQSDTQLEAFFWTLNTIAQRLAENLNENLFRDLALWNFGTDDFPPFSFEKYSTQEKQKITAAWSDLVSKGSVTKSDADEAYIRNMMGFPDKSEDGEEETSTDRVPILEDQDGQLPADQLNPEDGNPDDKATDEALIKDQPKEKQDMIRQEFAAKPWLKRVDFAMIKNVMNDQEMSFIADLNKIMAKVRESFEKQIIALSGGLSFGHVDPKLFNDVKVPASLINEYRKALRDNLFKALDRGYTIAKAELPAKGKYARRAKVIRPGMDKTQAERYISSRTMSISGKLNADLDAAINNTLQNALKYDKTLKDTIQSMDDNDTISALVPKVDSIGRTVNVPARLETIARTNISDAINQGRQALFGSPELKGFVEAYEYSSILDDRTTPVCEAYHGLIRKDWGMDTPPNHFNCRSILAPVTALDDWSGEESAMPSGVSPAKGFM